MAQMLLNNYSHSAALLWWTPLQRCFMRFLGAKMGSAQHTGRPWVRPAQFKANMVGQRGGTERYKSEIRCPQICTDFPWFSLDFINAKKVTLHSAYPEKLNQVHPRWPAKYESKSRRPAGVPSKNANLPPVSLSDLRDGASDYVSALRPYQLHYNSFFHETPNIVITMELIPTTS